MAITESAVSEALRQVIDPELGVNIVDLGLVYGIDVDGRRVRVTMTMTSPACPLGGYLSDLVASTVKRYIPDVKDVDVSLVWDPPWDSDLLSNAARQELGG